MSSRLFLFSHYRDSYSSCLLTLSRHGCRLSAVAYRIIDGALQPFRETPGATKVTSREPCPKLVSVRVSLVCAAQFTSTYRGFRWFSLNASRPSCLLPREVERCADNARAFSGVIKGLNPRSFVRRMTLILSTTPCEPATEQAINSFVAFRLHDGLAQILSAAMQRMQFVLIKFDVYYTCIACVGGNRGRMWVYIKLQVENT